ncbi:MAG TPA: sigma-70 family RNA polymerase sigma factor [Candidatus Binatus sp.]|nr:sigma-70 family RNA polymerase sigma factor [Candidatus Binatus sp.]
MRASREEPVDPLVPDEELITRLAADPSALGPLYDRHARLVYGLALAILGSTDEAQDLTQEVFLTLCTQTLFDPARGTVGAFLTTLVRSRAIDRVRRRGRRVRLLRAQWESAPPAEPPATPLDRVVLGQYSERVRHALADLPAQERRALEMAYYQGLTQVEIAEELGAPIGTVKSWCRRGLIGLKKALGDLVET